MIISQRPQLASNKVFLIKIAGVLPAGMTTPQFEELVNNGLSLSVGLRKLVLELRADVGEQGDGGLKQ